VDLPILTAPYPNTRFIMEKDHDIEMKTGVKTYSILILYHEISSVAEGNLKIHKARNNFLGL
jgi:hypothetical protein